MSNLPKPSEIRVAKDKKMLSITFDDGEHFDLEAELLRVYSPSAEVQGHSAEQRILVSGKSRVEIMKVYPVGNYAIRIEFDDMHDTGIYSWEFLYEMGFSKNDKWQSYHNELAAAGKTRDPV